jgi:hypothetical protein
VCFEISGIADGPTKQIQWKAFNRRKITHEKPPELPQVNEGLREFLFADAEVDPLKTKLFSNSVRW